MEMIHRKMKNNKEKPDEIKAGIIAQCYSKHICIECGKEIEQGILCVVCDEEE